MIIRTVNVSLSDGTALTLSGTVNSNGTLELDENSVEIIARELQWPLVYRALVTDTIDNEHRLLQAVAFIPFSGRTSGHIYEHWISTTVCVRSFTEQETSEEEVNEPPVTEEIINEEEE